ncbi:hypothetical protein [Pseudophaeobacter sp.]|uniref:hypothetical protein n=1 Tax=Pseudophaeobacter sp. TaxID=1971739 RepID=UPI0032D962D4
MEKFFLWFYSITTLPAALLHCSLMLFARGAPPSGSSTKRMVAIDGLDHGAPKGQHLTKDGNTVLLSVRGISTTLCRLRDRSPFNPTLRAGVRVYFKGLLTVATGAWFAKQGTM